QQRGTHRAVAVVVAYRADPEYARDDGSHGSLADHQHRRLQAVDFNAAGQHAPHHTAVAKGHDGGSNHRPTREPPGGPDGTDPLPLIGQCRQHSGTSYPTCAAKSLWTDARRKASSSVAVVLDSSKISMFRAMAASAICRLSIPCTISMSSARDCTDPPALSTTAASSSGWSLRTSTASRL